MPQRVLALDINDAEMKAAVLETTFRDYRVTGFYREPLTAANGTREEQLRRFLLRHGLVGDTVLSAIPGDAVIWRTFFLPFRDRKRLTQTIPFELESQVPFGLDEVVIDHHIVRRDRSGTTVIAAMVLKRDLERHLEMLQAAGIDPKVVDVGPLAALNALSLVPDLPPTFAFIDFGARVCTVALYRNGELVGLRTLNVGGPDAHANGVAADDSSHAGDGNGANGTAAAGEPTNGSASLSGVRRLSPGGEIRWTLLALNGAPLDDGLPCYVAGDPEDFEFLERPLKDAVGLEVRRLDRMRLRSLESEASQRAAAFTSPLGLALREVVPTNTIGVNFRRGEFTYHRSEQELRRGLRIVAALAALVVALTVADLYMDYRQQAVRAAQMDAQIRKVAAATLPDMTITAPKAQLQTEIDALQQRLDLLHGVMPANGSASVDIMRAIAAAIPNAIRVDCDEYTQDPEAVRIRANTDTFESVDAIKQALLGTGYFSEIEVKDVKTAKDGGAVDFRLRLALAKEIGAAKRQ